MATPSPADRTSRTIVSSPVSTVQAAHAQRAAPDSRRASQLAFHGRAAIFESHREMVAVSNDLACGAQIAVWAWRAPSRLKRRGSVSRVDDLKYIEGPSLGVGQSPGPVHGTLQALSRRRRRGDARVDHSARAWRRNQGQDGEERARQAQRPLAMASAMATCLTAASRCRRSASRPSTRRAPLPAFSGASKAAITARAQSISAASGVKA